MENFKFIVVVFLFFCFVFLCSFFLKEFSSSILAVTNFISLLLVPPGYFRHQLLIFHSLNGLENPRT